MLDIFLRLEVDSASYIQRPLDSGWEKEPMSFGIYAVGYLILIAGVAYLAHLMHIPQHYIVAIAVIMLGIGVITGVQTTRHKDPS
jgi:hypothetical protein